MAAAQLPIGTVYRRDISCWSNKLAFENNGDDSLRGAVLL